MKRIASILSAALVAGLFLAGCNNAANTAAPDTQADTTATAGSIVFFNIDKVVDEYDMANDLRSVLQTKVSGIESEIQRRQNKLQKDANDFQNKMDKGLLTSSVAQAQYQKLQQQQYDGQLYVENKQQEIAQEQQVVINQIMDAISEYVKKYNEEKHFALVLTTSNQLSPAIVTPVVTGSAALDITDEILAGLNAEYVKTKAAETK